MKPVLPRMAAALVPRELASWGLTSLALGALEGGLLGIIVKNQFSGVASPAMVNVAVAVVAAAPSFSNLSSFLFARLAIGADKLALTSGLMAIMGAGLAVMALPGINAMGLVIFCLMAVVARTAWSGILTIRAAVWRANYAREWRGHVTARIVQLGSLLVAGFSALIGYVLDWQENLYRPAFVIGAACSLVAAWVYRRGRIRRHRKLRALELAEQSLKGNRLTPAVLLDLLRGDEDFRHYMIGMMVFGSGNLMLLPMLVVLINDRLSVSQFNQVLITSSLPLFILCFSIPFWARILARLHIFTYRAIHSWLFVASSGMFAFAIILGSEILLWPASLLLGGA
ncbi:MAG TPA: hypothetical protein VKN35_01140, partial [Xanthomonadales bacterium]|nr:hypothetical protein [Xanthomonadales bacterium]